MYIAHEVALGKKSHFTTYDLGEYSSTVGHGQGTFLSLMKQVASVGKKKKLLLLDEQRFSRIAKDIHFTVGAPCTVKDIQFVLEPILQKYGGHQHEKLFYHIDSITINGEPSDQYIGKIGEIRCQVHIVSLYRDYRYEAKSVFGKDIALINIYPASFFTIHHIKKKLNKQKGTLLYIGENYIKRIAFQDGVFQASEVVELGREILKEIYNENNIHDLFNASDKDIDANPYAKNLVVQSVNFYVDMLMRWLRTYQHGGDIFVVSKLTQNKHFMQVFAKAYQQISLAYIVPLAHIKGLKSYNRTRDQAELDIQTATHYFV